MSTPPMISPAAREVLKKVRMVVPPLLEKFHKGMLALGLATYHVLISRRSIRTDSGHWRQQEVKQLTGNLETRPLTDSAVTPALHSSQPMPPRSWEPTW